MIIQDCIDLRWRDQQSGMERLLASLSWWLDTQGETIAAISVSNVARELESSRDSAALLDHLLDETDCLSVDEIISEWKKMHPE